MRTLVAILLMTSVLQAEIGTPIEEATKRWGNAAFVSQVQTVSGVTYEVGFVSIFGFGSRIVLGRGRSFDEAFRNADELAKRSINPPFHR